ncbi:hypothetical protein M9H77_02059 [Catharanthus roseus]|uniref:Uncharacterized protein n=1 Tax=Catharanthus roseus TaxID=4058 RepID=A0ACC0C7M1_CATRO|nr:hypothetical protein M9H77_02059 [Catharanthus roseus]
MVREHIFSKLTCDLSAAYKNAIREQKLALEISAAKRESSFYLSKVDQSHALSSIEERIKKKQKVQQEPEATSDGPEAQFVTKTIRQCPQKKLVGPKEEESKPGLSKDLLGISFSVQNVSQGLHCIIFFCTLLASDDVYAVEFPKENSTIRAYIEKVPWVLEHIILLAHDPWNSNMQSISHISLNMPPYNSLTPTIHWASPVVSVSRSPLLPTPVSASNSWPIVGSLQPTWTWLAASPRPVSAPASSGSHWTRAMLTASFSATTTNSISPFSSGDNFSGMTS